MDSKKNSLIIFILILFFAIALYAYQNSPSETVATHWNAKGEVDGQMSKTFGIFLMPVIASFLYFLFLFIPRIDPLKKT